MMSTESGPSEQPENGDQKKGRFFLQIWSRFVSSIRAVFSPIIWAAGQVGHFLLDASDRAVVDFIRYSQDGRLLNSALKNIKRLVFIGALIGSLVVLVRETIVFIDYDFDGVVLRMGKFHRTMTPGINFKIPVVEKLYVVNTEDRRQEHFGFVQFTAPLPPQTDREVMKREREEEFLEDEHQEQVESTDTGDVTVEVERSPRLTRSYLLDNEIEAEEEAEPSEEEEEVEERLDVRAQAVERIIPPDGKVPVPEEMKMITGDLGIVYLTYSVQYEIVIPQQFLFNSVDVRRNLRDLSQVALRVAVGDSSTAGVLSYQREQVENEARKFLQEVVSYYKLGIRITNVIIQDANPPDQVRAAFNRVNSAKQEMENTIHLAEAEYNATLPQLLGKADRLISEAISYKTRLVNSAEGEAKRFESVLAEYKKAPDVIRTRYFIEAQEDLHGRMDFTLIDPSLKGILPIFSDREASDFTSPYSQANGHIVDRAISGTAHSSGFEFYPGQEALQHDKLPVAGPHNILPHLSDPLGVDPAEQRAINALQADIPTGPATRGTGVNKPAATEVQPADLKNPEVKP